MIIFKLLENFTLFYRYYFVKVDNIIILLKFLDSIPNINRGGCGFSAYAIYTWIEEYGNLEENTTIVYCDTCEDNYDITNIAINTGNYEYNKACSHAYLHHLDSYIDSSGCKDVVKYSKQTFIPRNILKPFMQQSLGNYIYWNRSFDRSYVKIIENKLKIKLL